MSDWLLDFGILVFGVCNSYEEDLAKNVLEIITVCSAQLYGSRSRRNHRRLEKLMEVADTSEQSL